MVEPKIFYIIALLSLIFGLGTLFIYPDLQGSGEVQNSQNASELRYILTALFLYFTCVFFVIGRMWNPGQSNFHSLAREEQFHDEDGHYAEEGHYQESKKRFFQRANEQVEVMQDEEDFYSHPLSERPPSIAQGISANYDTYHPRQSSSLEQVPTHTKKARMEAEEYNRARTYSPGLNLKPFESIVDKDTRLKREPGERRRPRVTRSAEKESGTTMTTTTRNTKTEKPKKKVMVSKTKPPVQKKKVSRKELRKNLLRTKSKI